MDYISQNHSKYLLMAHLIFSCKYRKKLLSRYGKHIKQILYDIAEEKDLNIAKTRQIKSFLSQKSFQNQPRLVIIHQAHLLRPPAQNALLKTLEDPPLGTYIFLLASQKDFFLPTILSRCQIIKVAPTPPVVSSSLLAPLMSQDDSKRLAFSQTEAKKLDPKNFIQTELSFWQTKINPSDPRLSGKIIQ